MTSLTPKEREAQVNVIRSLLDTGIDAHAQDVEGNMPLHYLAATLNVDPGAVQLLRGMEGGEEVYNNSLNREGLSPRSMWGRQAQP
ncbi:hypothetical protein BDV59DRAFT_197386 [Aspergillus ambiguus]|uniref:ankyrin repeat domain-containing protein n=1 Tax=Aspergillus ambiguus TaxID=176160 RepID=UPI003CCE1545